MAVFPVNQDDFFQQAELKKPLKTNIVSFFLNYQGQVITASETIVGLITLKVKN